MTTRRSKRVYRVHCIRTRWQIPCDSLGATETVTGTTIGNLLPAWVKVACIDISPATVTKLMDRGTTQTVGIVSDAEPFLRSLVHELEKPA